MPSRLTTPQALDDARACAAALGVRHQLLPINGPAEAFETTLAGAFADGMRDRATRDNLNASARAAMLMALCDRFGWMPIGAGSKSDMACGRAARAGDLTVGFNPVKDLYATEILRFARLRNRWKPDFALGPDGAVIPQSTLARPLDAGRGEGAAQDGLPPYEILDDILAGLIERNMRVSDIVAGGHAREAVVAVERLWMGAEDRRRRAAPGVQLTGVSPGDGRYPIVNGFNDAGEAAHTPDGALVAGIGRAAAESFDF